MPAYDRHRVGAVPKLGWRPFQSTDEFHRVGTICGSSASGIEMKTTYQLVGQSLPFVGFPSVFVVSKPLFSDLCC